MQSPVPIDGESDSLALHQALVDQLKAKGHISTQSIEAAFRAVPRHLFLPNLPPHEVYRDQAITTKSIDGQSVSSSSQPTMMAIMLEQLQLQPGHHVLEIGAGPGYNAALMAHIVGETGQVVTIDIDEDIVEGAREHLAMAGFDRVQVVCSDGGLGYPDAAPYDRIILTVNASDITPAWREQLKADGRLLLPLVVRGPQVAVAFEYVEDHLESVSIRSCGFVNLRGAFAEPSCYIQLDSEPGLLYLRFGEPRPVDAEAVYQMLTGPNHTLSTTLQVTQQEIFSGLSFWLTLHERQFCDLVAHGAAAEQGIVPALFTFSGKGRTCSTLGLLDENALCVLVRNPDSASPPEAFFDLLPFIIGVRSFGSEDTLAHRLREQIMAWDRAGRPDEQRLHIRAYPRNAAPVLSDNDIVLIRKWTSFIFDWRNA